MKFDEIISAITAICKNNGVKELFLFGSYATGTQTDSSDIDIIVKGCTNDSVLLQQIDDIPTLKKIDVFFYDTCNDAVLLEAMNRYGKRIY